MKKILLLNIFLLFIVLFPVFSQDANTISVDKIDNVSPPDWILGTWILEEDSDEPFVIEFLEQDIVMDEYSTEEDIESGFIIAFSQNITPEYYDIYVKFDNGEWFKERFFITSTDEMESEFSASDGTELSFIYSRD